MRAVIDYQRAVDDHMGDAVGVLLRVVEGGVCPDGVGVEDDHVTGRVRVPVEAHGFTGEEESPRRCRRRRPSRSSAQLPGTPATAGLWTVHRDRRTSARWLLPGFHTRCLRPPQGVRRRHQYSRWTRVVAIATLPLPARSSHPSAPGKPLPKRIAGCGHLAGQPATRLRASRFVRPPPPGLPP